MPARAGLAAAVSARRGALALLGLGLVLALLLWSSGARSGSEAVHLLAGAGLRPGIDAVAVAFEREYGIPVAVDYGGSGLLLSRCQMGRGIDLFLPGEAWYLDQFTARGGQLVARADIGPLQPVLIVATGNPLRIAGLADLRRPGVVCGLGRAQATSIGRVSDAILAAAGLRRAQLQSLESLTVNELGLWLRLGTIHAAIVWQATAANLGDAVDVLALPAEWCPPCRLVLGELAGARPQSAALRAYLTGPRGRAVLRAAGFLGAVEAPAGAPDSQLEDWP